MTARRRALLTILAVGVALWLVTLVPYLLGYANAPRGHVFNGFFYLADDATTYVSKMREGAEGSLGWSDRYIASPTAQPVLVFLFYILWGKVAALLHVGLYVGYHLARLSGAVALVGGAWMLVSRCLEERGQRLTAMVLLLTGSGLGYLAAILRFPTIAGERLEALDFHLPELSGFYSILAIPHFSWAAALLAISISLAFDLHRRGPGRRRTALLAAAILGLCVIHPQMLVVLALVLGGYLLVGRARARTWLALAIAFVPSLPLLAYFVVVLTRDPVIVEWSRQWRHQAPGPISLALALGLPLAFATATMVRRRAFATPELAALAAWIVVVALLLYLPNPVNIQRRLVDGLYLPVAVLAAVTISDWFGARRRLAFAARALPAISTLVVLGISVLWAVGQQPFLYLSTGEVEAMDWLARQPHSSCAPPVVLSDPDTGLFIPARAGLRVYVGHYSETLDYVRRARNAREAYRDGLNGAAALARREGAEFIFLGPRETMLRGESTSPPAPVGIRRVAGFDADVSIYQTGAAAPAGVTGGPLAPPC
ncbi:MAG: hypothetical protein ACYDGR_10600 [Candidatus Dormibacteria bacterium]